MPCLIKYTGPTTDASKYFKISPSLSASEPEDPATSKENGNTTTDENPVEEKAGELEKKTAHFRGRKLKGVSIPVPDGYIGTFLFLIPLKNIEKN